MTICKRQTIKNFKQCKPTIKGLYSNKYIKIVCIKILSGKADNKLLFKK